jgi:GT2 family glycosyltransferase
LLDEHLVICVPDEILIDISVVTFNSTAWIKRFLNSLLTQSFPCLQLSILWRDNGSSDGTTELLHQLKTELGGRFKRFEVDSGENIGFGRGHNSNFEKCTADYFLVSNVDLEFEHCTLKNLAQKALTDDKKVAIWECAQRPFEHPKNYNPVNCETLWASSACALFRSSAFRQIAGYEPRIFLYGEDVEISYRLRDQGFKLRYVPNAIVWHYTYSLAGEAKPAQFLGSTLGNVLLRCRYGNWREVLTGFLMFVGLFIVRPQFPGQRKSLAKNLLRLLALAPYFLLTRRSSSCHFPFNTWDYDYSREGAFFEFDANLVKQDLVSVLVRTMPGRSGKLKEAVASVLNQTYPKIELVVVEDGGCSAQSYLDEIKSQGLLTKVTYLSVEKMGRCHAGNRALAAASGNFF